MTTWENLKVKLRAKLISNEVRPGANPLIEHRMLLELLAEEIDRLNEQNRLLQLQLWGVVKIPADT